MKLQLLFTFFSLSLSTPITDSDDSTAKGIKYTFVNFYLKLCYF